jgi:hypothetical protein
MIVEGINFNDKRIKAMTKKEFIAECANVFFLDREIDKRKDILSEIYDKIRGVSNKKVDD